MKRIGLRTTFRMRARFWAVAGAVLAAAGGVAGGCDALNPAFLEVVLPPEAQGPTTTENARGHVPIFVINNTEFDGQLLDYLASQGVDTTDPDLRPRVRVFVEVEFVNGNLHQFEFVDGSQVVQASADIGGQTQFVGQLPTDLTDPELINQVVQCDVSRVQIMFASATEFMIEVFIPVFLKEIQVQQGTVGQPATRELVDWTQPQFVRLLVDEVGNTGDTVTLRNLGIRDLPAPAAPRCGAVVAFVLDGILSVPFVEDENGALVPGFLDTAEEVQAAIPGRYKAVTTMR